MNSSRTPWRIAGEEVTVCNCAWGCPCQFNALPTHGRCEGMIAASVREGFYGEAKLNGLVFAEAIWFPGAVHEGKGISRIAIDDRATTQQRAALVNIITAKDGGLPFEIYAALTEIFLEPLFVPIGFQTDRERRRALFKAPGLGEFRTEPIRNPITGQEHRATIRLPNGFEYKEAEMGNAVVMQAAVGDKVLSSQNSYAQLNAFEWSNK